MTDRLAQCRAISDTIMIGISYLTLSMIYPIIAIKNLEMPDLRGHCLNIPYLLFLLPFDIFPRRRGFPAFLIIELLFSSGSFRDKFHRYGCQIPSRSCQHAPVSDGFSKLLTLPTLHMTDYARVSYRSDGFFHCLSNDTMTYHLR